MTNQAMILNGEYVLVITCLDNIKAWDWELIYNYQFLKMSRCIGVFLFFMLKLRKIKMYLFLKV